MSIEFLNTVLVFFLHFPIHQLLDNGTMSQAKQSPVLVEQVRFQRVVYRGNGIKDDRAVPGQHFELLLGYDIPEVEQCQLHLPYMDVQIAQGILIQSAGVVGARGALVSRRTR